MSALVGRLGFVPNDPRPVAHWVIYKDEHNCPEYPWFFEHRIVGDHHPRLAHDEEDHEYGSVETWDKAMQCVIQFSREECA